MKGTGLIKIEQPFEGDNKVYYVNGGRCSGKVDKIINELVYCINELLKENQKYKEVIDKAIEYINDNLIISSILDGKKYYTINNYSFDYRELLDILKEVSE